MRIEVCADQCAGVHADLQARARLQVEVAAELALVGVGRHEVFTTAGLGSWEGDAGEPVLGDERVRLLRVDTCTELGQALAIHRLRSPRRDGSNVPFILTCYRL